MGRMKELYMELMEEYGYELPEDFSLAEHQLKKELEYEELREIEERLKQSQASVNRDEKDSSRSSETKEI
jgi:beta-phosphoglucomutase-like phosphatase (HAD superfamily)